MQRSTLGVFGLAAAIAAAACACPQAKETPPAGGQQPAAAAVAPAAEPTAPAPGGGDRTPAVAGSDPSFARVEGTDFQNACQSDAQCFTGGCGNEVCSAEQGVTSTCEAKNW